MTTDSELPGPKCPYPIFEHRERILQRVKAARAMVPAATEFDTLSSRIDALVKVEPGHSFGEDIDLANSVMLDENATLQEKEAAFRHWGRKSPCLFARMGMRDQQGVHITTCWISKADIDDGAIAVSTKIQAGRMAWKKEALEGHSSSFVIIFNDARLALAAPTEGLLAMMERLSSLYLVEHAPIGRDVIYSEAIPFSAQGQTVLFKAGINVFYCSAHETWNHDRRAPGGVVISINSPGHLAHSMVKRGTAKDLDAAVEETFRLAMLSLNRGGVHRANGQSSSWHNTDPDAPASCPYRKRLGVKDGVSLSRYSAHYHTDVLVPTQATLAATDDWISPWTDLVIDYPSASPVPNGHPNYGLYFGHPIDRKSLYVNPWLPRSVEKSAPNRERE